MITVARATVIQMTCSRQLSIEWYGLRLARTVLGLASSLISRYLTLLIIRVVFRVTCCLVLNEVNIFRFEVIKRSLT